MESFFASVGSRRMWTAGAGWSLTVVSFLKGDLQFSKFLKNTICIGLCKLKYTEKRFIPFSPLHFLPEFVPHTEFKGRPEDTKWNVVAT